VEYSDDEKHKFINSTENTQNTVEIFYPENTDKTEIPLTE
jgi:hypothetical protein